MNIRLVPLTMALIATLFITGCGDKVSDRSESNHAADSPAAAMEGMVALAEAGEWEAYVTTYYGEQHKMDKPETQVPKIAAKLKKAGSTLLLALKDCIGKTPTLSEDGTRAEYPNGFPLYKRDGRWGFHL